MNLSHVGQPNYAKPLYLAMAVIILFFGAFFAWSLFSPLESAAIAMGHVNAMNKQKTIEHLEGGIVDEIYVNEGDHVEAGQLLIRLDKTQAQANLTLLHKRRYVAEALKSRLEAERDMAAYIEFSEELTQNNTPEQQSILNGQQQIFIARTAIRTEKLGILNQQIEQHKIEIEGLQNEVRYLEERIEISEQEIEAYHSLERQGMSEGKVRLNAIRRELADTKGEHARTLAGISRSRQKIFETELRIKALEAEHNDDIVQQLKEVQSELFELEERILAASDVLKRTDIRVPMSGIVVGLTVHSPQSVISPGETLMGIVPDNKTLIVEVKLDPQDIDNLHIGQKAYVRLTALSSRRFPPLKGALSHISADHFIDERSGQTYFEAKVTIDDTSTINDAGIPLLLGMQAEVMVVTGAKTPMEYLLEPLLLSFNRALRDS